MRTYRAFATSTAFTAVLTLSFTALAAPEGADCKVDADCDGELLCEVTGAFGGCSAPACQPGQDCPEPVCETGEIRSCVAPPCQSDADCGAGLRCVRDTFESCTDCDVPAGDPVPAECGTCETESYTACVPKPCATDDDCGDPNLVCIEETWESCSGDVALCGPGEKCPEPVTSCQTESISFCAPKYVAPCQEAADCGAGFDCVPEESCGCSGSAGGTDPDRPDADPMPEPIEPVPPEESCSCEPTGRNYCEPHEIECPNGDECPVDWECTTDGVNPTACPPGIDCPVPEPPTPTCLPPMWGMLEGSDGVAGSASDDERSLVNLLEAPAANPSDPGPEATGDTTGSGSSDSGGCAVATPGGATGTTGLGLLALLGLVFASRRRR